MLQKFLDEGLLLDIGDEGDKFAALENATPTIVKSLLEDRGKLPTFTLVALDAKATEDEPAFAEVEVAVKEHWKTLRNKHKETPRQLYRAVILEALEKAGGEDECAAAVIWLSGESYLRYARVEERAVPLCRELLVRLGERMEKRASREWTLNTSVEPVKLPAWALKLANAKAASVDLEQLTKGFAAAAGPQDQSGVALVDPNPYGPQQGMTWSYQFAPRAAKSVAGAVNGVGKAILGSLQPLEETLQKHGAAVNAAVQKGVAAAINGVVVQQRRGALLWWKETLFSETRRRSYRGLGAGDAAVLMAYDLHQTVSTSSPQSVEFLLRETVRAALPSEATPLTFQEVMADLQRDHQKLALGELLGSGEEVPGRLTFHAFLQRVLAGKLQPAALAERTGLNPKDKITADDLAVWLFRDLQAQRCIEEDEE